MSATIVKLLESKNMSVTKVSEISNVSLSTLRNEIVKPIETWSIRVLNAFAIGLGERPGDLLNALEAQPYILDINDETQTIQGVFIADKETYQQIRTVVEVNHLEGGNPTKSDIQELLDEAINPNPQVAERFEKIWEQEQ
ncbi:helix-turn-helix domain-containing protein [Lactobacillus apis]|uniref:helix-turn-helix domain-containing protein n=1 Tax=Lactobacillus apis TaxID=303541 RepID=UPI0027428445|nr:helix-turn-helix domain-containing protein [Lactobacillus apis]WLS84746.1 XRE family transcriptional regulator [Lactobacillus apis]